MDTKAHNQRQRARRVFTSATPDMTSSESVSLPLKTPPPEEEALAAKLALEIEHLEVWLESQQGAQQGPISVIPTIKSLIHTRKRLLKNIQANI